MPGEVLQFEPTDNESGSSSVGEHSEDSDDDRLSDLSCMVGTTGTLCHAWNQSNNSASSFFIPRVRHTLGTPKFVYSFVSCHHWAVSAVEDPQHTFPTEANTKAAIFCDTTSSAMCTVWSH